LCVKCAEIIQIVIITFMLLAVYSKRALPHDLH
jgi:hypothetical protein